tara:strand:- start:458 stop:634 length:177 start_codon:yes stop_codon:yes gene_type:complete
MKVLGMKMTLKNIVLLVLAVLGVVYLLNKVGVKVPLLEFMDGAHSGAHNDNPNQPSST